MSWSRRLSLLPIAPSSFILHRCFPSKPLACLISLWHLLLRRPKMTEAKRKRPRGGGNGDRNETQQQVTQVPIGGMSAFKDSACPVFKWVVTRCMCVCTACVSVCAHSPHACLRPCIVLRAMKQICFHHKKLSCSVCSQNLALQKASCIVDAQSKYLSAPGACIYLQFFFEPILFSFSVL